nr:preprotein translocase subunit SecG [Phenylobacterium sp.]
MLIGILLAAQIVVSLILIGVVLLQRSEGGGFVGGGSPSGMMSVRGAGDLLTRTTWILGSAFFIISLLLTILAGREKGASSVVDRLKIDNVNPNALQQPKPSQPPGGTAQPGNPQSGPTPLQAPTPTVRNPFLGDTQGQPAPTAPPQK